MKNKKGFTLFELLVSISIIAILVAVASTSFSAAQKKARDARRMEDMESVRKAAEQYYMLSNGSYPLQALWVAGQAWTVNSQSVLPVFPSDPKGIGYTVPTTATATAYCMCAFSENASGNSTDRNCSYAAAGTKNWYCVSNQQ